MPGMMAAQIDMPTAAPRFCPRCRDAHAGQCPARVALYERSRRFGRGTNKERGYDETWTRVRERLLAGEPLCRACYSAGLVTAAADVDHIVPLRAGGARLDESNLQPLCRACHRLKTQEDAGRWPMNET
jgi:5-methylcytosine-specific restriction enzyme A